MKIHTPAPNDVYFIVVFEDEDLSVPLIQTLLFKEIGRRRDGAEFYLFQELHSDREPTEMAVDVEHANHLVLDSGELIEKLTRSLAGKLATAPK